MAYTKYSLTPANNNAAPPDGAPEGMLPSAVNDTMRDMMAQIRDVGDGIRGGTYTMTAPVITGGSITGVALSGNTLTNPVITGGSINNTTVGATTASTGAFTTLSATGATTFSGTTVISGSATANTLASSGATLTGGSINGMAVGGTTAAAGKFTTLEATGVTTVQAGTVSAPAITTTGDTNTGIYFPAADTIAFTEGGVESMRIDSSGILNLTNNPIFTGGTANGIAFLNGSKVLTTGSAITFDPSSRLNLVLASATATPTWNAVDAFRITGSAGGESFSFTQLHTGVASGVSGYMFANGVNRSVGGMVYENNTSSLYFTQNTTERMRITGAGNVGIGTSSPTQRLSIIAAAGTLALSAQTTAAGDIARFSDGVAQTLIIKTDASGITLNNANSGYIAFANTTERMRLDSSGNLGLGVTPSAWDSSIFRAIQIGTGIGTAAIAGRVDSTSYSLLGANLYYGSGSLRYTGTGTASYYAQNTGAHQWFNAPSGTAGNAITFTQAMTLNASGQLGIGTTSPQGKFVVSNGGANGFEYDPVTSKINSYNRSTSAFTSLTIDTADTRFFISGAERMRIDSSGNVLVGITSARANAGDVQVSKGISFPATQSAQSDANTLDDYEEGTWTGTVSDGTNNATMASNAGYYTKIGNIVNVTGYFVMSSKGSISGNLRLTGLPFTVVNNNAGYSSSALGYAANFNITAGQSIGVFTIINSTYLDLTLWDGAAGTTGLQATETQNISQFILNITYRVA
jgi:hypothetical protein